MTTCYETPDYEPPDDDEPDEDDGNPDLIEAMLRELTEAQPEHFCECRPGAELRQPWQHADTCRRWTPPLGGPGSTDEGRARARAEYQRIRDEIAAAKRRHPQNQPARQETA